jgi:hypothetical protein
LRGEGVLAGSGPHRFVPTAVKIHSEPLGRAPSM